jgi:hypothetical protein
MKKKLFGMLLVGALLLTAIPVTASAAPPQTDVTGVVTKSGNPVAGAVVTAKCMGNTEVDASTDAAGSYLVIFPIGDCPFGSTVNVTAKKGGDTGSNSGTAQGLTTKLNVAIVNVAIPEYGLIGGLLAAAAGVGAVVVTRRRFSQNSGSNLAV